MTTSIAQHDVSTRPPVRREPSPFNLPNFLTATRFVLAIFMFVLIAYEQWLLTGVAFFLASVTDWLDGLAARRLGIVSSFGRSFDPLVDKMLICGAYICLLPFGEPRTGVQPWMVVAVVTRELLVTSLRGYIESLGIAFGADKWGKLKMVLQCLALAMILFCLLFDQMKVLLDYTTQLELARDLLIYAMVLATILSGLQYMWTSYRLYKQYEESLH
ncbi:MAG: CDP-diacylglycerol--glycerol-3-phosphate 3-phosphatidyltransferase [Planctomycetia bacterium]|nr:CDP-diacylglycerol--glycerol-3-phosphate 3-phosphatidyltransferase [Planctomycetia bacterium]